MDFKKRPVCSFWQIKTAPKSLPPNLPAHRRRQSHPATIHRFHKSYIQAIDIQAIDIQAIDFQAIDFQAACFLLLLELLQRDAESTDLLER